MYIYNNITNTKQINHENDNFYLKNIKKNINYFKTHLKDELIILLSGTLVVIYWRSIWLLLDNITDVRNNTIHLLFIVISYFILVLIHKENVLE